MNTKFQVLNRKKLVNASKQLLIPHFLGFFKPLKEGKIKSNDLDEELSKYIKLNKKNQVI